MRASTPTEPGAKMTIHVYKVDREGTVVEDRGTVSVPRGQEPPSVEVPKLRTTSMRAAATWFLDQPTPPRPESLKLFARDFRRFLRLLVPCVERLTGECPEDDVPAKVALAGVGEARRRLAEIDSTGLVVEVDVEVKAERVRRLARSVISLCDHFDALTGVTMCLTCDKRIADGEESVPYGAGGQDGGAGHGRVHTLCADGIRHCR